MVLAVATSSEAVAVQTCLTAVVQPPRVRDGASSSDAPASSLCSPLEERQLTALIDVCVRQCGALERGHTDIHAQFVHLSACLETLTHEQRAWHTAVRHAQDHFLAQICASMDTGHALVSQCSEGLRGTYDAVVRLQRAQQAHAVRSLWYSLIGYGCGSLVSVGIVCWLLH